MSASASSSSVATLARRPSRCATASESRSRACSVESALKIGRISAASRPCWSLRAWPRQSLRKWTVQRCQAQPSTLAMAAFRPACASEIAELDADQAPLDEASEELGPKRLGLGLADIDGEDLAPAGLVHAMRDHQRLVDHAAAVAHLLDLRVQEHVGVAALQRPGPERVDVLIERAADAADLTLAHPQPEALDQLVDPPGRDAADISLLDDGQQRLLGPPARLQDAREI